MPLEQMIDSIYPWTLFDSKAGSLLGLVFTNILQHLSLRLGNHFVWLPSDGEMFPINSYK